MRVEQENIELNGQVLVLRNAEEEDAEQLIEYLKTVSGETKFLIKEPEELTMTVEEERQFIAHQNESPETVMLLGILDGEHVGNCSLMRLMQSRYNHRASIAIALYQNYTRRGIGKRMLQKMFQIAEAMGIEQLELEVAADNDKAVSLYQSLGFQIYGTFPDNMKYKDGTYANVYWMMKKLSASAHN